MKKSDSLFHLLYLFCFFYSSDITNNHLPDEIVNIQTACAADSDEPEYSTEIASYCS